MEKTGFARLLTSLVLCLLRWRGSQVLKQHYDPAVARMAGLFEQPFRPLPQDLEYYLTLAYPTVRGCCAGVRSGGPACSCVTVFSGLAPPCCATTTQMFEREMKRPSKEAVTPVNVNVPTVLFGENGVYSAAWQTA